jgi:transketolase
MAIASRFLAENFNRPGFTTFDFNVYALCGDVDMMEGISSEAASIAGHLQLSNLCWIYDSNRVTIEGHTDIAFTEDVAARFLSYGWEVIRVTDPNDLGMIERAYGESEATRDRPTIIIVHSHIGYGAPHKQDPPVAHGEPLGPEKVRLTKEFFGFSPDQTFVVPPGVKEHFSANMGGRGVELRKKWEELFARYHSQYPDLAQQITLIRTRELPSEWKKALLIFPPSDTGVSTRDASGKVLNVPAQKFHGWSGAPPISHQVPRLG